MEIERKFLIKKIPNLSNIKCDKIIQSYLSCDPVIRIRNVNDEKYYITIKSDGDIAREELEMEINKRQFDKLKEKAGNEIIKNRYKMPFNKYIIELDIYEKCNILNLITAEIEFNSVEEAIDFKVPDWFADEVTYNSNYKNNNLL